MLKNLIVNLIVGSVAIVLFDLLSPNGKTRDLVMRILGIYLICFIAEPLLGFVLSL